MNIEWAYPANSLLTAKKTSARYVGKSDLIRSVILIENLENVKE